MTHNIDHYLSWIGDNNQLRSELLSPAKGSLVLGRSPLSDIELINTSISRKHMKISWDQQHLVVTDLTSSFGTWVDNEKLAPEQIKTIYHDTEIRVGNLSLWYEMRSADSIDETMQTCFFAGDEPPEIEFSVEINTFRTNLQQQLKNHLGLQSLPSELMKDIDDNLSSLNETQHEVLKEQKILHSISYMLNRSLTTEELTKTALNLVSKVLNAERGFVLLASENATTDSAFELNSSRNFSTADNQQEHQLIHEHSKELIENCRQQNKILMVGDATLNDPQLGIGNIHKSKSRSIVVIPLPLGNQVIGIIYLDNQRQAHCFEPKQLPFLKTFASHTSIALNNAQLYKRATTDHLTKLYTRSYIDKRIAQEIQRAQSHQTPFNILLIDLDNFKKVNDRYGHTGGDHALQTFAKIIESQIRDCDRACRFGGEEFLVVLPGTDHNSAKLCAERIRQATEQAEIKKEDRIIKITVSIGISSYKIAQGSNAILLLEEADQALYQAKEQGRNSVVVYS
ncbi:MAG: diguanylate cyclase (GGDEF)-like protein [Cognaticolwellia sp.]|jgi:diguanylate cyclase (GGDEF)-like protein